jgi:predicted nucleic acid-binding protein
MKYVLDSSVALKWVLAEADSAKAIRLRDDYSRGVHQLVALDIFLLGVANGLASAERQGRIKSGESATLLHDVVRTAPAIHATPPLLLRAMAVAIATRRAVYDCIYLALADTEQCELLTADDQFARALRASHRFIVSLAALP